MESPELDMTGWIAVGPDSGDTAFLLLTTSSNTPEGMSELATALQLGAPGTVTRAAHLTATITGDHVTVSHADILVERPTSPEWARAATSRGEVMLIVGLDPLRRDPTPDEIDRYASPERGHRLVLALIGCALD